MIQKFCTSIPVEVLEALEKYWEEEYEEDYLTDSKDLKE